MTNAAFGNRESPSRREHRQNAVDPVPFWLDLDQIFEISTRIRLKEADPNRELKKVNYDAKDKTQIEILDFFYKKSCKAVESNRFLYLSRELLFFFFKVNTSFLVLILSLNQRNCWSCENKDFRKHKMYLLTFCNTSRQK